jgi:hypothetical protein
MRCEVCGMDHGLSHSCSGIAPPRTHAEAASSPPGIAPGYYLGLAFRIARWDDVAIRRAARDPDSLFYGAVFSALTAAVIFLGTAFPRMVREHAWGAGKFFSELLLGMLFVWLSFGCIAFLQIGLCHLLAKWFIGGTGTLVGVTRPLLLGWFVNFLLLIPVVGPMVAAIAWTAVMLRVVEEADHVPRFPAFLLSGGVIGTFLALQFLLPR